MPCPRHAAGWRAGRSPSENTAVDRASARRARDARAAGAPPSSPIAWCCAASASETGLDQAHTLITGAAPISVHVLRFFHALGLEVLEGYGMSENMTVTTVNRRGHARLGTVGQVVPRGASCASPDDGEILMRGDVLFAGYYKDPAATAETVVDGWLHTGDIGELDGDGYLRITDRKKDLIITAGGKNVVARRTSRTRCAAS